MASDEEDVLITETDLAALKNDVLKENVDEIAAQLGDPGRYFASFKAKEILDRTDCETIKAQVTSVDKANVFIDTISGRKGRRGEHPYDIFVGALKRMKVHIHIVRILNQALAKKRAELKILKRVESECDGFVYGRLVFFFILSSFVLVCVHVHVYGMCTFLSPCHSFYLSIYHIS